MTTFIQAIILAISIAFIILVVKLQVDYDIKKIHEDLKRMQKKFDEVYKEEIDKK